MKLLNQSLLYLFGPLFILISAWAVFFYFNILDEVYDSIDDGLENSKQLIISKAVEDPTLLDRPQFAEGNYTIREVPPTEAPLEYDVYRDTLMYVLNETKLEHVRLLTTAFAVNNRTYELEVINPTVEEDNQVEHLLWSVLGLYLLLLVSMALINNFVLKRLWQPFYDYLGQLKQFRIDRDDALQPMDTDTREFLELKRSADVLISHSREVYRNQKRFNENAAHELQTPLAVITSKLELLLEDPQLSEQHSAIVGQVMETTTRLIKLNQSLLLLSKIENKQFFDNEPVSLNQTARRVAGELEEMLAFRNIELSYVEETELKVTMDAHLAYILLANLLRNAIFHNQPGGRITVRLTDRALAISNTSASGPLVPDRVFDRFYKESSARKSSGLGLAIVRAITDLYGFDVSYSFSGEHGFTVRM